MIFGSYTWGTLADLKGRKWIIISCLLLDAFSGFASSFVQNFYGFLACRFFNGFGIIGATSLIFSYLGEFLSIKYRDTMLCRLEIFWTFGMILLPVIAWLVIPLTFEIPILSLITYNSWRAFVALCGLPSLLTAAVLCLFPESPRFLLIKGEEEKAHSVLSHIYAINTNKHPADYPILSLQSEQDNFLNNNSISSFIHTISNYHEFSVRLNDAWIQNRSLFKRPYIKYLFITCFADFGLMASYYTLIMWFPDLFDRFDQYQATHSADANGICEVTSVAVPTNATILDICKEPIDDKVFLYTLIVALSCIPTAISLGFWMDKLGKKYLLIFSLIASGCSALALNLIRNGVENLIVSCIFEAITSTTEAVIFCLVVDLFPTHLRAVALALTVTCGRIGAILGNIVFGILIDLNCIVPIYTFGCLLIASGFLCFSIPKTGYTIIF
ncbi:synaptic vesicle glycoprotein 2C-like isoform X2 [Chrysoperla carnea]|nr:synaptic vesicle glycoprotein 2C-like isoform X2 [Chrysoperla carnea]XP_044738667.1 synaptic vesicle glycoprotein 2C-like isoform X2 [Chrysoperla carnea]